jgi:hypothetical protein
MSVVCLRQFILWIFDRDGAAQRPLVAPRPRSPCAAVVRWPELRPGPDVANLRPSGEKVHTGTCKDKGVADPRYGVVPVTDHQHDVAREVDRVRHAETKNSHFPLPFRSREW